MRLAVVVKGLFALASLLPLGAFAQAPCAPNSSSFTVQVQPGYIAPQQAIQVSAQLCNSYNPYLSGFVITFNIVDIQRNTLVATYTGITNANGFAAATVSGLPADIYSVTANVDPNGDAPRGQTTANFTVGGGQSAGALKGQFVFMLQGSTGSAGNGFGPKAAVAGVFTADGNGNITSGEADLNSVQAVHEQVPVTGNYTLNPVGMGDLYLKTPLGNLTLSLTTSQAQAEVSVQTATFTALPPTAVYGSGTIARQDTASIAQLTYPVGTFVVKLDGETACGSDCTAGSAPALPASATGQFNLIAEGNLNYLGATLDQTAGTFVQAGQQESGTIGALDSSGRSLLSFTQASPGFPTELVTYLIDATHFYVLSLDPHSGAVLVSGSGAQ